MVSIPQLAIRGFTLFWSVLALALVGAAIHDAFAGNPSSVNFAIFVAVISVLFALYGFVAAIVESLALAFVLMITDAIAMLASLIAGIVLAAKLGVHSCGNKSYLVSNNLTNGAHNMGRRCHELQAATAFFWFMFVGFAASLALVVMGHKRGGIRRGGPTMSQV